MSVGIQRLTHALIDMQPSVHAPLPKPHTLHSQQPVVPRKRPRIYSHTSHGSGAFVTAPLPTLERPDQLLRSDQYNPVHPLLHDTGHNFGHYAFSALLQIPIEKSITIIRTIVSIRTKSTRTKC